MMTTNEIEAKRERDALEILNIIDVIGRTLRKVAQGHNLKLQLSSAPASGRCPRSGT